MNKRIDKKRQKMAAQPITPIAPAACPECIEKAAEKSVERHVSFYVQYQDQEYLESDIVARVTELCKTEGASDQDLADLSIYLKPEDKKAYYAYTGKNGAIDL